MHRGVRSCPLQPTCPRDAVRPAARTRCFASPGISCTAGRNRTSPRPRRSPGGRRLMCRSCSRRFRTSTKRYPPPFNWIERYARSRRAGSSRSARPCSTCSTRRGFATRPTRVIPPGVDTARFAPDRGGARRSPAALGWQRRRAGGRISRPLRAGKGRELLTATLDRLLAPVARAASSGPARSSATCARWARRHGDRVAIETAVAPRRRAALAERDGPAVRAEPDDARVARAVRPDADRSLRVRRAGHRVRQRGDSARRRRRRHRRPGGRRRRVDAGDRAGCSAIGRSGATLAQRGGSAARGDLRLAGRRAAARSTSSSEILARRDVTPAR